MFSHRCIGSKSTETLWNEAYHLCTLKSWIHEELEFCDGPDNAVILVIPLPTCHTFTPHPQLFTSYTCIHTQPIYAFLNILYASDFFFVTSSPKYVWFHITSLWWLTILQNDVRAHTFQERVKSFWADVKHMNIPKFNWLICVFGFPAQMVPEVSTMKSHPQEHQDHKNQINVALQKYFISDYLQFERYFQNSTFHCYLWILNSCCLSIYNDNSNNI